MWWCWQSIVKEPFPDNFVLLLIIIIDFRVLLVMQRNLISLNEIIIEMDWQHLRVLHLLLNIFWQLLAVNILILLILLTNRSWIISSILRSTFLCRRSFARRMWGLFRYLSCVLLSLMEILLLLNLLFLLVSHLLLLDQLLLNLHRLHQDLKLLLLLVLLLLQNH
jgi:hypothetical protein